MGRWRRESDVSQTQDILLEAIEELRKRTTAGAATFPVKVKAHRGEPANEEADIQGKDVSTDPWWHDRQIDSLDMHGKSLAEKEVRWAMNQTSKIDVEQRGVEGD